MANTPYIRLSPLVNNSGFYSYANDAAFVAGKGSSAVDGDAYYNSTDNVLRVYQSGAWTTFSNQTPVGSMMDYCGSSAPSGWVLANGRTIGSGSSGATERANSDTVTLYTLLWNSSADSELAVSGGRGASAAADFAANKTIALPDCRGRVVAGNDTMGSGSSANRIVNQFNGDTAFITGGGEEVTLTANQSGSVAHTHGVGTYATASSGSHSHNIGVNTGGAGVDHLSSGSFSNGGGPVYTGNGAADTDSEGSHTHSLSGSSASNSGASASSAHSSMQPTIIMTKIIKL